MEKEERTEREHDRACKGRTDTTTEEKEKECEESIKSTFITKYQNDIDNARKEKLERKESLIN